jgi:pyrroline-5-carboxylate reductase
MKIENYRLGFVGFGHIGQAIFRRLDASRMIPRSQVLFHRRDPSKAKQNEQEFKITSTTLSHLVEASTLIFLCAPSSQAEFILQDIAKMPGANKMILSVMTGIKISFLQKYLGPRSQVVRMTTSIASSIGQGMNLLCFGPQPSMEFRSSIALISSSLGQIMEVAEPQMDIAGCMAGAGSVFALDLIDSMARHVEKEGIAYAKGLKIAAQTFSGAAQLVLKGFVPQEIVDQVVRSDEAAKLGMKEFRSSDAAKRLQEALRIAIDHSRKSSEEYF